MTNIEKLIIAHNKDAHNRKLVAAYNQKSLMEKYGVARSEPAHSAFIANLLLGNDIHCAVAEAPIMWLLHILIEREDNATAYTDKIIPADVKLAVLTQTLQYKVVEVTPEKKLKLVAPDYFQRNWSNVAECEDALDIYIKLHVYKLNIDEIEIFIENKVLFPENGPKNQILRKGYDDLCQTERYYIACSSTASTHKMQLFVFLTPDEVRSETTAINKHFIQIAYQDVLDTIITPLLDNEDLSPFLRIELENYVNALNLPTIDVKEEKRIVMAKTNKTKQDLQDYVTKNKELVKEVLSAVCKRVAGYQLTHDEQTLVGFVENKRNLFAALGADFANISETSFFVIITEHSVLHIECLSSTDVAVRYAKLYKQYYHSLTVAQLNKAFSSIKGVNNHKPLFATSAISKIANNQPMYARIDSNIWFEKDLWTTKSRYWRKLLNFINSNNDDLTAEFTYEVVAFD